jgi:mannose-6-phosphate isomerase-like protein (cupin superfamily)
LNESQIAGESTRRRVAALRDAAASYVQEMSRADMAVYRDFERLRLAPQSIDDEAAELILQKPYGLNRILKWRNRAVGLSTAVLFPHCGTSTHLHDTRKEVFLVLRGAVIFTFGGEMCQLESGDFGVSVPNQPHRLWNASVVSAHILEMFSPADLDDKRRLEDRYGRKIGCVMHSE